MKFSERMGFKPTKLELQTDSMSVDLRNSLWSVVHAYYLNNDDKRPGYSYGGRLTILAKAAQFQFFKLPIDDIEDSGYDYIQRVKKWFLKSDFYQIYDFIEWLAQFSASTRDEQSRGLRFAEAVNARLDEERSAYRFVDNRLVPITNKAELSAVNDAATVKVGFEAVAAHVQAAIGLFSDKKKPDFRNCVKEAISAVEAAARIVTGNDKATLRDALKELEKMKKIILHFGTAF